MELMSWRVQDVSNSHSPTYPEPRNSTFNSALFSSLGTPLLGVQATELGTQHSFPHSELGTRNSELTSPTLLPTQHSALSTQHSVPYSS
uniref:Uncharacterized protein n=1 Tax=Desertifilum tharense IPPAS B-1220 TaxID=1781255 RepID=A0ACD5GTR1_9CYAN